MDAKDKAGRTPMIFAQGIFLAVRPPEAKPEAMALLKKLIRPTSQAMTRSFDTGHRRRLWR